MKSIIGSRGLNCWVRNVTRCCPSDVSPEHKVLGCFCKIKIICTQKRLTLSVSYVWIFLYLLYQITIPNVLFGKRKFLLFSCFLIGLRPISTPQLNTFLCFHLVPIKLIISQWSQTISHLEVGFPLRCFQRLSIPDIATRQCFWRNSR